MDGADVDLVGLRDRTALGPAHEGADAGQQLAQRERLRQVVVGAQLQADHAVHDLALGREHEDGHSVAGRAQLAKDVEPGAAGKQDVQHHELRAELADRGHGLVAAPDDPHFIAFVPEVVAQAPRQGRLVLHHQHARRHAPGSGRGARTDAGGTAGRRRVKTQPRPSSLTRSTRPPCPCATCSAK